MMVYAVTGQAHPRHDAKSNSLWNGCDTVCLNMGGKLSLQTR